MRFQKERWLRPRSFFCEVRLDAGGLRTNMRGAGEEVFDKGPATDRGGTGRKSSGLLVRVFARLAGSRADLRASGGAVR